MNRGLLSNVFIRLVECRRGPGALIHRPNRDSLDSLILT